MTTAERRAQLRESQARYRLTDKGQAAQRRKHENYKRSPARAVARIRYKERHPAEEAARTALQHAVRVGRIERQPCIRCGATPADGHHYLGYAPEHHLHIVWLCGEHHRLAHRPAVRRAS